MSAECALKCILTGLGHIKISDWTSTPLPPYGCHINKLWNEYYNAALDGRVDAKYRMSIANNPFATWNVNHRYNDSAPTHIDVTHHEAAARAALGMMQLAMIDGKVQ